VTLLFIVLFNIRHFTLDDGFLIIYISLIFAKIIKKLDFVVMVIAVNFYTIEGIIKADGSWRETGKVNDQKSRRRWRTV
jgi:hypothetical protein